MGSPRVKLTAKSKFNQSTRYKIDVESGLSYGRCVKKWDEFEALYDALEMRHGEKVQELAPFPKYATRRDNTKAEAVEQNRAGLEGLLNALLQDPALASDHDLAAFLQLTEAMGDTATQSPGSAAQPGLEQRPGPTPLSVRPDARPAGLDEADATEEGADGAESSGWGGQNAVSAGGHAAMEPADGGVWIGR